MKFKKQKRHRRSVRFYTACFGFREPFKVLCDGTFIHHLVANRISPPDTALSKILGASVKIFTTRCVLAELKSLGESYSASLKEGHNFIPARCDHEKRKSAVACIEEVIGEKNPEHFFVATQDVELRRKFQEIAAVPVIFGLRNALFLESPSEAQLNFAKSDEEKRLHMTELEYKMLQLSKKKRQATEEPGDSSDANEGEEDQILLNHALKKKSSTKSMDVKDKVQFKRKRAKGPNPLSCKKKKSNEIPKPISQEKSAEGDSTLRSRSKRKRKRPNKNKIIAEAADNLLFTVGRRDTMREIQKSSINVKNLMLFPGRKYLVIPAKEHDYTSPHNVKPSSLFFKKPPKSSAAL